MKKETLTEKGGRGIKKEMKGKGETMASERTRNQWDSKNSDIKSTTATATFCPRAWLPNPKTAVFLLPSFLMAPHKYFKSIAGFVSHIVLPLFLVHQGEGSSPSVSQNRPWMESPEDKEVSLSAPREHCRDTPLYVL